MHEILLCGSMVIPVGSLRPPSRTSYMCNSLWWRHACPLHPKGVVVDTLWGEVVFVSRRSNRVSVSSLSSCCSRPEHWRDLKEVYLPSRRLRDHTLCNERRISDVVSATGQATENFPTSKYPSSIFHLSWKFACFMKVLVLVHITCDLLLVDDRQE